MLSRDVRWSFGTGFEIAVALYAMIQPAVKGTYTYVKAQNNEPLRSETAYICMTQVSQLASTGQHCLSIVGSTAFSQGSIAFL